ncbi:hypothetical protein I4U23_013428 [Adineta vaga]|nr:hypothetical protein I4U23_013428 [Adineta vaga]
MSTPMTKRVEEFLQHKQDYDWFIASYKGQREQVHCEERVVSKTNSDVSTKRKCEEPGQNPYQKQAVVTTSLGVSTKSNFEASGQDLCEERLVVTTFPSNLAKADFEEYVDRKFSNLDNNNREKMKELFNVDTNSDIQTYVSFDNESNDAIGATLTQILLERNNDYNELKISVGYIKFTSRSTCDSNYLRDYWQSNTERVVKALQYKYGLELKNELCYNS